MPLDINVEIAQRLGVSENELQPVLETVVQRIRQQVAHYGYARLSGLGTFRGRDGTLIFEPDPGLAEAVNLRFAGLEPIRIEHSRGDADASRSEVAPTPAPVDEEAPSLPEEQPLSALADDEEEDDWQELDAAEGEHPLGPLPPSAFEDAEYSLVEEEDAEDLAADEAETHPAEPEESFAGPGAHESEDSDEEPLPELSFEDEEEIPTRDEPTEDSLLGAAVSEREIVEQDQEAEASERTPAADDEPYPQEATGRDWPSERSGPAGSDGRDSRRNTILIVLGFIVLLAAGAIAYFALQPPGETDPEIAAEAQNEQAADTTSGGAAASGADAGADGAAQTGAEGDGGDATTSQDDGGGQADQPTTPAAESTPLRGPGGISVANGGFTIVVYSETSEGSADNVVQRYVGQGFRSDVVPSQEGGVTRYRVGVGQFETLEDAMDARNQLAGTQLPADAWVYRLE